jgi:hypothetical protein
MAVCRNPASYTAAVLRQSCGLKILTCQRSTQVEGIVTQHLVTVICFCLCRPVRRERSQTRIVHQNWPLLYHHDHTHELNLNLLVITDMFVDHSLCADSVKK